MYRITMIALLLGLSGTVSAKPEKTAIQMDGQAPVAEQVRRVERALDDGEYSEISADDRAQVQQALARITQRMGTTARFRSSRRRSGQRSSTTGADQHRSCPRPRRQPPDLPAHPHHGQQHAQEPLPDGGRAPPDRGKGKALLNDQRTFNNLTPPSNR